MYVRTSHNKYVFSVYIITLHIINKSWQQLYYLFISPVQMIVPSYNLCEVHCKRFFDILIFIY